MNEKKLKLVTEILAIIVIALISFVGVYKQNASQFENQVKDFKFDRDLEGYRELVFNVSDATQVLDTEGKYLGTTDDYSDETISSAGYQKTETKINSDESLTEENYNKAKSIIEKRLASFGVQDYNLSLNVENGTMYLQIPENSTTDHTISNILEISKFEIKDSEDSSKVFLTNDDIERASSVYGQDTSGTTVYLQLQFNKNGKNVLKELSEGEYKTKEEEPEEESQEENETEDQNAVEAEVNISTNEASTDENTVAENQEENSSEETETEEEQKKITLSIDGTELITTSFDDPIEDGVINLSMGQPSKDNDTISSSLESTATVASLLNDGVMPITYKVVDNKYVKTDITNSILFKCILGIAVVVAIGLVLLIIKYKFRGLLAAISFVGFVSILLLVIRYTNVAISIETIVAGTVILVINYLLTLGLLKINEKDEELKQKAYKKALTTWLKNLIPVSIITIMFVFVNVEKLELFGMVMFWGLFISIIYNYFLTRDMLDE